MTALAILALLFVLLAVGTPVGFAMAFAGSVGLLVTGGPPVLFGILQTTPLSTVTSYELITIPMFLLMADLVLLSGVADDLFKTASAWVGRIPGGLGMATALAGAGFGAICGTSTASAATLSSTSLPAMIRQGYEPKMAAGVVAISGTLAMLLPTSVALVLFGLLAEVNIGQLLISGIIPAMLVTATIMGTIYLLVTLDPSRAPRGALVSWSERFRLLRQVSPMVILFGIVTGTIYLGIATPTEASAFGAFGALLLAGAKRKLTPSSLYKTLLRATHGTCMITMILLGASIFGYFFTLSHVTQDLGRVCRRATGVAVDHHRVAVGGLHRTRFLHGPDRDPGAHRSDRIAAHQIAWLRSDLVRRDQDRHRRSGHDHAPCRPELFYRRALCGAPSRRGLPGYVSPFHCPPDRDCDPSSISGNNSVAAVENDWALMRSATRAAAWTLTEYQRSLLASGFGIGAVYAALSGAPC
jgi:tripartite ATP-independent transporter DctM subunit